MLGQYRILGEILIFAAGLTITSYILLSFSDVRDFIGSASTGDKLENIASNIINGVVKASTENSFLVMEVPEKVSEKEYTIKIADGSGGECNKGDDCFLNMSAGDISIARQLFNISQNYNIKGDVQSTARFLTIFSDISEEKIILGRV